jgi:DNA repair protein RecO (recombination protein O)
MIIKTEGIVLKTFDLRETSKIAILFSKDHGKVKGVLKGIRKDPRKFGSSLDKFSLNEFVYYQYSRSELHLISQCDLKQYFFPVRQDYKRNLAANYMTELVDVVMQVEQKNEKIYRLILRYLKELEVIKDVDKLVYIFQIKMLLHSGFRPHLDSCVKCSKKIYNRARFSAKEGGLVCDKCPSFEQSFTAISKGAISTILHIEQGSWSSALKVGLTKMVRDELKYVLNNFLVYHLERKIKSSKYL